MNKTKLLCVVGSRSEAIKMAPVIMALRNGNTFAICILATAPRRHLLGMAYDLRFGCDAPQPDVAGTDGETHGQH